jgi:hypothetical protein
MTFSFYSGRSPDRYWNIRTEIFNSFVPHITRLTLLDAYTRALQYWFGFRINFEICGRSRPEWSRVRRSWFPNVVVRRHPKRDHPVFRVHNNATKHDYNSIAYPPSALNGRDCLQVTYGHAFGTHPGLRPQTLCIATVARLSLATTANVARYIGVNHFFPLHEPKKKISINVRSS